MRQDAYAISLALQLLTDCRDGRDLDYSQRADLGFMDYELTNERLAADSKRRLCQDLGWALTHKDPDA